MKKTISHQDNENVEKMESNGLRSCDDKSRHTNIRYFFIKDVLAREGIYLVHCPIERMISDYCTKPLQDSLVRNLRDIIMVLTPFPDEEHVRLN